MSNTLPDRVQLLIDEAGSRAAFIERVWPRSRGKALSANTAKLSKWVGGKSGMSLGEIEQVARAFKRRPAWVLWGELPERVGSSRDDASLYSDVAAYVRSELTSIGRRMKWPPRLLFEVGGSMNGKAFLDLSVERAAVTVLEAWNRTQAIVDSAAPAIEAALDDTFKAKGASPILVQNTVDMWRRNLTSVELQRQLAQNVGFIGDPNKSILVEMEKLREIAKRASDERRAVEQRAKRRRASGKA